ncbi:MAG: hypothetical protein ACOYXM_04860 [Actinomycetota bacterium]
MTDVPGRPGAAWIDLYWIPLGAGQNSVRINGIVYEATLAALQRRGRCDLYHAVLELRVPSGHYWIEMTPVPDRHGDRRGVVAQGPVGLAALGRFRLFRYEIRCWPDGVVPDLAYAVDSPVRLTTDLLMAQRVFDFLPRVPTLVWGRDECSVGDMWSCNSIISWTLARAGVDVSSIRMPTHARAPGWEAGIAIAHAKCNRLRTATVTGSGVPEGAPIGKGP